MGIVKTCVVCGNEFEATSARSITCGPDCAKVRKAQRQAFLRKGSKPTEAEVEVKPVISEIEVEAVEVTVEPEVAVEPVNSEIEVEEVIEQPAEPDPVSESEPLNSEIESPEPEATPVISEIEPKVKEKKAEKVKKEVPADMKWVLTVKDKSTKSFKNIVFFTNDVKVPHAFIDNMRKEKVLSFVSLTDTDRIDRYLDHNEVTKLFSGNLKAIADRKVPADPKVMFKDVRDVINSAAEGVDVLTIDLVVPEVVTDATA